MMRLRRAVRSDLGGGDDDMTWEPLDMSRPNAARVSNALLGGYFL